MGGFLSCKSRRLLDLSRIRSMDGTYWRSHNEVTTETQQVTACPGRDCSYGRLVRGMESTGRLGSFWVGPVCFIPCAVRRPTPSLKNTPMRVDDLSSCPVWGSSGSFCGPFPEEGLPLPKLAGCNGRMREFVEMVRRYAIIATVLCNCLCGLEPGQAI